MLLDSSESALACITGGVFSFAYTHNLFNIQSVSIIPSFVARWLRPVVDWWRACGEPGAGESTAIVCLNICVLSSLLSLSHLHSHPIAGTSSFLVSSTVGRHTGHSTCRTARRNRTPTAPVGDAANAAHCECGLFCLVRSMFHELVTHTANK
jgi:hypothetical protein